MRINKEELKIKEYHLFRAHYCGVCLELKKRYGQISRFLLNYDTTFLGLFLSSLYQHQEKIVRKRCPAHPMKKQLMIEDNFWLAFAADMNILLAYHNLRDKWQDDKSFTSLSMLFLLKSAFGKASRLHPNETGLIKKGIDELAQLEKSKSPDLDAVSHTFAQIIEGICPGDDFPQAEKKAVKWLAYNLGKWIYLIDAFDDLADDIKRKRYNPLIYTFNYQGEDPAQFQDRIKPQGEFLLTMTLSQIAQAYELLPFAHNRGILENIIYLGMKQQTDLVLNQRSCQKSEQKLLRDSWCPEKCQQR